MQTDLLALIAQLARASQFREACAQICGFCEQLESVAQCFVLKSDPGALSLQLIAGEVEASPRLLMRVEHALREWASGIKPPPDHMTGYPPPHAVGVKSVDGAPPIHAYPTRAPKEGLSMMALCIVPNAAVTANIREQNLMLSARDLLKLAENTPERPELEESAPKDSKRFKFRRDEILTRSPIMEKIFRKLDRVVGLKVPVLVMGETGTGKELIARAVHRSSDRHKRRFYAQNCGAINEGILESELFGYTKGAFTGADRDRKGLFEIASGSTLFLDEIGEMNMEMQKKLLRVLQEGEVMPIGASLPVPVDVRIVCATNRNLKEEVKLGRFREDLYFRLQVIQLTLPPLRERSEDIPLLIDHFLDKVAARRGRQRKTLDRRDARVLEAFFKHDWPGNIRELENTVTRLAHFAGEFISYDVIAEDQQFMSELKKDDDDSPRPVRPLDTVLEEVERAEILNALRHTHGNRTHAADLLRVNRRSLLRRLKKYEIE